MADPAAITDVLGAAGYVDIDTEGHRAPMWFGHDAEDAFGFVVGLHGWLLETMNDEERSRALDALRTTIGSPRDARGRLLRLCGVVDPGAAALSAATLAAAPGSVQAVTIGASSA